MDNRNYLTPVPPPPPYPVVVAPTRNGLATAGLVLGILSVVFVAAGIAELVMVVLAITFAAAGLSRERRHLGGQGKAQAGLVLGIVGGVFYLLVGLVTAGITLLI